jgi:hypothetical protein
MREAEPVHACGPQRNVPIVQASWEHRQAGALHIGRFAENAGGPGIPRIKEVGIAPGAAQGATVMMCEVEVVDTPSD